jgi:hypothetical protein
MLAKPLALILCCASAIAAPLRAADQPQLVQLVQPYAQQLRAEGITRVTSLGARDMVRWKRSARVRQISGRRPDVAFIRRWSDKRAGVRRDVRQAAGRGCLLRCRRP